MKTKDSLNFNLRQPHKKSPTPLYAVIRKDGKQTKIALGVNVLPLYWDERKQSIIIERVAQKDIEQAFRIQSLINFYKLAYINYKAYFCNENDISFQNYLTKELPKEFKIMANEQNLRPGNGRMPKATTLLTKAFNIYYKEIESDAKESSKNTTLTQLNGFKRYCKDIKRDAPSMLTQKGLNDYLEYMFEQNEKADKQRNKKIGNQQIKRRYDVLAMLINKVLSVRSEFTRYHLAKVEKSSIKVPKVKGDDKKRRPLITAELLAIKKAVNLTEEEAEYRDLFIVECNSSCRIGDIPKIFDVSQHEIHRTESGRSFMTFTTQKEGIPAIVWLRPELEELLKKYDCGFKYAKPDSGRSFNNKMNIMLRRIFRKAGLTKVERFVDQYGEKQEKQLCDIITSHWARYTFIYNGLFEWGMTSDELRRFTAHADHKMIDEVYDVYRDSTAKSVEYVDKTIERLGIDKDKSVPKSEEVRKEVVYISEEDKIKEYKEVLAFYGEPYQNYFYINDYEELLRMIVENYETPLKRHDWNSKLLKEIFNSKTIEAKEKLEKLQKTIKEIRNELK